MLKVFEYALIIFILPLLTFCGITFHKISNTEKYISSIQMKLIDISIDESIVIYIVGID